MRVGLVRGLVLLVVVSLSAPVGAEVRLGERRSMTSSFLACTTIDAYLQAMEMLDHKESTAIKQMVAAGRCTGYTKGDVVVVEDLSFFPMFVKIRPLGTIHSWWTTGHMLEEPPLPR